MKLDICFYIVANLIIVLINKNNSNSLLFKYKINIVIIFNLLCIKSKIMIIINAFYFLIIIQKCYEKFSKLVKTNNCFAFKLHAGFI